MNRSTEYEMTDSGLRGRVPWPGPRPYGESDRDLFFGRETEVDEFLRRLIPEQLLVLPAPSAVGKTSFLRAGLVPRLRMRRSEAVERNLLSRQPAVVIVRDWTIADSGPDALLVDAIAEGIKGLRTAAEAYDGAVKAAVIGDFERLVSVERRSSALDYMADLADAVGSVTLILDQFEEALQGGSTVSDIQLCGLIHEAFHEFRTVQWLLSFRIEAQSRLTPLAKLVNLTDRTLELRPLSLPAARGAVLAAASKATVAFEEGALDDLLDWMRSGSSLRAGQPPENRRPASVGNLDDEPIDLLKLQALLLEVYDSAARWDLDVLPVAITRSTLDRLKREMAPEGALTAQRVVETVLQRYIDGLLPLPAGLADPSGLGDGGVLSPEDQLLLRRRRAAARMGPSFSSGGFKQAQEQSDLLARAWREEWEVLGIDVQDVENELGDAPGLEPGKVDLPWLNLAESNDDASQSPQSRLAGIARKHRWGIRKAANDLIDTSLQALESLAAEEHSLLRRKELRDGKVQYELVHDGFSDPLFDWSEQARKGPLDALSATTAERGTSFRWGKLSGRIELMNWRGCWIGPNPGKGSTNRLLIEDVHFRGCDLRATVFERCDFVGGGFENCNLGGAVFWDCALLGTESDPYVFSAIKAAGLTFDRRSSLSHVQFENVCQLHNMSWDRLSLEDVLISGCVVHQMSVEEVTMSGPLAFRNSWMLLSDLVELRPSEAVAELLTIRDCDLLHCRLEKTADQVAAHPSNLRFPSAIEDEPTLRNLAPGLDPSRLDPWSLPS